MTGHLPVASVATLLAADTLAGCAPTAAMLQTWHRLRLAVLHSISNCPIQPPDTASIIVFTSSSIIIVIIVIIIITIIIIIIIALHVTPWAAGQSAGIEDGLVLDTSRLGEVQ